MYFESLQAALQMDGHGIYVWPAYVVTLLALSAVLIVPARRRRRILRELAAAQARDNAVSARTGEEGS